MKINTLFSVFIALCSFCCYDKIVKQPETIGVKMGNKNDTIPEMNLLDSEYELKERLTDSVLEIMMPNVPTMKLEKLNRPFYKYMTGVFNGDSAILNLNFAHFTYDGNWAFMCTIFIPTKVRAYEFWGIKSDTVKFIELYVKDRAEANFDALFTILGHFDKNQAFKGITLDNRNLKRGSFEFQESNTEGAYFDMTECYALESYKVPIENNRKFSLVYAKSLPIPKSNNNKRVYSFLKKHFRENTHCSSFCSSFMDKGSKVIKKVLEDTLEDDFSQRDTDYYSLISRNSIYWNKDDLVVISKDDWNKTTLGDYGESKVNFETYDVKRSRKITENDVFKEDYDDEKFAGAIIDFFGWDKEQDKDGKIKFTLQMPNGFTSKGFYMVGKGNHGWYVSPVFIPYKIVEPFLKDDFKTQYWKK